MQPDNQMPMPPNMPPTPPSGAPMPPQQPQGQVPQMMQQPQMPMPGQMPGQMPMNSQQMHQMQVAQQQAEARRAAKVKEANNQTTTQKSLIFSELRDSMIIMNDGGFRAVVACESINFDLMSNREREGIEYSYQDFLNSLMFPIQIFIRSQRVDIAPYLELLDKFRQNQDNMLINVLMTDYINFIDAVSQEANIMEKSFYIIIPYSPTTDATQIVGQSKSFFAKLFGGGGTAVTKIDQETYFKSKDELNNRVESVLSGLMSIGVQSMRLNTKQLGELYYNVYNPDTAVNQPLPNYQNMTTTYVRKGQGAPPSIRFASGDPK